MEIDPGFGVPLHVAWWHAYYNPILISAIVVWLLAELIKWGIRWRMDGRSRFMHPGGMPSGHSTITSATAMGAGLVEGFDSTVFAVAVVLMAVVVHDAVRLRGSVGRQAEAINALITEKSSIVPAVFVWYGHRIREVMVGVAFGAVGAALILYFLRAL